MREERRVQNIIDIVSENPSISSEEVDERLRILAQKRLESKREREREEAEATRLRGDESEQIVKGIIERFSFVKQVRQTAHGDLEDLMGADLVVHFDNDTFVDIQVKSSEAGIKKFKGNVKQAERKLKARRLILINGRDKEKEIQKTFLAQLKRIDAYHGVRRGRILSRSARRSIIDNLKNLDK